MVFSWTLASVGQLLLILIPIISPEGSDSSTIVIAGAVEEAAMLLNGNDMKHKGP